MLAVLLLLGMAPTGQRVSSGPWAPHLRHDPAEQWRLGARDDWRAFQQRWGGRWGVRWDPRNATPRFLWAPGVPVAAADALVADVARLAGVDADELVAAGSHRRGERTITRWTRAWRGAPVEGDEVAIVAIDGRIGAVWARLTPVRLDVAPARGEVVLPVPPKGAPALVRRAEEGGFVVYRDRAGAEVHRYDQRLYAGTLTHTYEERTVGDALVTGPARDVTLTDAAGATSLTADDGTHALSGAVDAWLDGPTLAVTQNGAELHVVTTADGVMQANVDMPYSAATVLQHFHVVWDWLGARWPSHAWLASRVPADVENAGGTCNAYYTGGTLTFFPGASGACNDLGRIADVVYHEVGHGIHEYILAAGTFASDVSEGSADYISATINDDAEISPNAYPSGAAIREIATDKRYPDDVTGEPHNDGLVWASFLWNLREDWGDEATDALFLGALEQGPTLTDLYEAVVVADDDDGDLTNGTPNGCDLMDRLAEHGLGPGPIGVVRFDHTPLGPQSSWTEGYDVSFVLEDLLPDCTGLDPDSVVVYWTTGDTAVPPVEPPPSGSEGDTGFADTGVGDTGGVPADPWAAWTSLPLSHTGADWTGTIPRQLAGTRVRYLIQGTSTDGTQTVRAEGADADVASTFWVGDREALWCADFEAGFTDWTHGADVGDDQWATGTALGGTTWDPDAPVDGAVHAATVIEGDYAASTRQWLQSPAIHVGTDLGPMTLLTWQRWLTVEDALYDQADVWVNGARHWSNTATEGGSTHHLDVAWTSQDEEVAPLLDDAGDLSLRWTLSSDMGLEFGGWQLDAVCVVTLADVPGHYRVRDLVATDDADVVTVSWTNPWIAPLAGTVLVRKLDGWPTGPDDGEVLDEEVDATPGEARVVTDTDAAPGETWYYAVFAAREAEFELQVVDGENADAGGVPAPPDPEDTGDTGDTGPVEDTGDSAAVDEDEDGPVEKAPEAGGCGCGTTGGGGTGAAGLAMAALLLRRRRR